MLSVVPAFAEFEHSPIRRRQQKGIALAKRRGAYKGRTKPLTPARRPSGSSALATVFRTLLLLITGPARRRFASTSDTPTWSEPLPCRRRRYAAADVALTDGELPAAGNHRASAPNRVLPRTTQHGNP
ncbi:recombinase family protein [Arthrobacter sp. 2MCAF14]